MPRTAVLIGDPISCQRLKQQLELMDASEKPDCLGYVFTQPAASAQPRAGLADGTILGTTDQLKSLIAQHRPDLALVCLPAAMSDLITQLRTQLRKLGVPDRFVPTLEDLVDGVGPRTHLTIDPTQLLGRPPRYTDELAVRRVVGGRRTLITGAGGSIGSELARIVAKYEPSELALMERSENALFEIDRQIARWHPDVRRHAVLHDIVRERETRRLFQNLKPQVIFHAAAHKHVPMMEIHPRAAVENNVFGTKSVADAADAVGADRFILISTDKAVKPASVMGATKRLAELYVQHANTRSATSFSIVRFGNVLASAASVLEVWSRQIADGGPLTVTDPRMTRYFMTIHEAATLVIQAAALSDAEGEVFVLDMGRPIRILTLAKRFVAMHGLKPVLPGDPPPVTARGSLPIVFTGVRPGEKLHEQLATSERANGIDLRGRATEHPDIHAWSAPPPANWSAERMLQLLGHGQSETPEALSELIWALLEEGKPQPVAA